jgi:hypothetical protein
MSPEPARHLYATLRCGRYLRQRKRQAGVVRRRDSKNGKGFWKPVPHQQGSSTAARTPVPSAFFEDLMVETCSSETVLTVWELITRRRRCAMLLKLQRLLTSFFQTRTHLAAGFCRRLCLGRKQRRKL